jgi:hypothetical protein
VGPCAQALVRDRPILITAVLFLITAGIVVFFAPPVP